MLTYQKQQQQKNIQKCKQYEGNKFSCQINEFSYKFVHSTIFIEVLMYPPTHVKAYK